MSTHLGERLPLFVREALVGSAVEIAAEQTAPEATDAESGWLFGGEQQNFYGSPRLETRTLQGADRLQSAEDADRSIELSCVWNGVDVGSRANRWQVRLRA